MLTFVFFVVGLVVVGGLLFLGASVLLGRGETRPPADLDRSPVELPDDRPVTSADLRALRMSVAVRGYRMSEVDWLVDLLAHALDDRDAEIARLRSGPAPDGAPPSDGAPLSGAHAAPDGAPVPAGTDDGVPTGPGGEGEELPRA